MRPVAKDRGDRGKPFFDAARKQQPRAERILQVRRQHDRPEDAAVFLYDQVKVRAGGPFAAIYGGSLATEGCLYESRVDAANGLA